MHNTKNAYNIKDREKSIIITEIIELKKQLSNIVNCQSLIQRLIFCQENVPIMYIRFHPALQVLLRKTSERKQSFRIHT